MPQILVENLQGLQISVPEGTTKSVLQIVQQNFVDWMHACGAKGRCTTCRMVVKEGMEGLSSPTRFEEKMRDKNRLAANERLSCQTQVQEGHIVIRVPKDTQLPHQTYSD
ncbi:MAG TPA: ferredoxin [Cytophagales bacterium]|nr:ferredoxin [Cytophagales bacterium]HAP62742.1 ferredoxin [Cytophagales bacterium]